jgi:hypothetical protein
MYFIIWKPINEHRFKYFTNEIFQTEEDAVDYGKRNKFCKSKWKVIEYNEENYNKYWR